MGLDTIEIEGSVEGFYDRAKTEHKKYDPGHLLPIVASNHPQILLFASLNTNFANLA